MINSNQIKNSYSPPLPRRAWFFFIKVLWFSLKPISWLNNAIGGLIRYLDQYLKFVTYPLRKNDIFIVTYPRSGTTWLQMILYQLTTDGNMEFNHITEKIPFFERSFGLKEKKTPHEGASRRIFKTHLSYKLIPKGHCKYIYVVRDGRDVCVSCYYHFKSLSRYDAPFSTFFGHFIKGKIQYKSWFKHVHRWYRNRAKLDVLYLSYEELKTDLHDTIKRIAQFCEISVDDEHLKRAVERSGFSFMKAHEEKFEHITEIMVENRWSLGKFIREGKTKYWPSYFDPGMTERYNKQYKKWIENKAKV